MMKSITVTFIVASLISLAVVVTAVSSSTAVGGGSEHEPFVGPLVDQAKELIIKAQKDDEVMADHIQQSCQAEIDSLKKWNSTLATLEAANIGGAHNSLVQAVEGRLGALSDTLRKLLDLRAKLGRHIGRVNQIFAWQHDSNMRDVNYATDILRHLGAALGTHDAFRDPSLDPIEFEPHPLHDVYPSEGASGQDRAATVGPKPSVFLEQAVARDYLDVNSAAVQQLFENAQLSSSDKHVGNYIEAYRRTVSLYNKALNNWRRIKSDFEQERSVLTRFKEQLDKVLEAKHKMLETLKAQLADLQAAMAAGAGEGALAGAEDYLMRHKTIFVRACKDAVSVHDHFTQMRAGVLSDIEGGIQPEDMESLPSEEAVHEPQQATGAPSTPSATGATGSSPPSPPPPAAATGTEKPAAATGNSESEAPVEDGGAERVEQPEEAEQPEEPEGVEVPEVRVPPGSSSGKSEGSSAPPGAHAGKTDTASEYPGAPTAGQADENEAAESGEVVEKQ